MSQFQTKPKSHFLVLLPNESSDKKLLKWFQALCAAIISKHQLHIKAESKVDYPELDNYKLKKSTEQFCEQVNNLVILVPQDTDLHHLHWLDTRKHRLVVYGFKQSGLTEKIIMNICDGILWMDRLPDSISTTVPVHAITTRSKTKWNRFVDHDWWQEGPSKSAVEFCNMKNFFLNEVHETKMKYEKNLDILQSTYREEIKAWSETAANKTSQSSPLHNASSPIKLEQSNNSSLEKKLHAKEVYIRDLETRLDRYENQTLSVIWHQIKQFFNVIMIRLPLTICLLAYHIFSTYYHRYKSSSKPL